MLDGLPAQAYDWDIQKQVEVAKLGQDFVGYFAWHYPPPVPARRFLAGTASVSNSLYRLGRGRLRMPFWSRDMRAIVSNCGFMVALAIPMVFIDALVGQNGTLTAALIGGTLYLIPIRPVLAGVCLGC